MNQASSLKCLSDRTRSGKTLSLFEQLPKNLCRRLAQNIQQFTGSPIRMLTTPFYEKSRHLVAHSMRTGVRSAAAIRQSRNSTFTVTVQPLVARLAADPVFRAQFTHRKGAARKSDYKTST